jgi:hypothetical protein
MSLRPVRFFVAVTAALAAACAAGVAVQAQALTYATANRTMHVGVAIPQSMDQGIAPGQTTTTRAPYLFQILDSRADLKPAGWNLTNPLAPSRVDAPTLQRWNRNPQPATVSLTDPYTMGQPVTKDMACYWEVPLSRATPEQLCGYDVLYLAGGTAAALTDEERDKLRRAVDAGVILWIDTSRGYGANAAAAFTSVGFGQKLPTANATILQPLHPLLTNPYSVDAQELNTVVSLGVTSIEAVPNSMEMPVVSGVAGVSSGRSPFVASGPYGAGYVVMFGAPVAAAINAAALQGSQARPWASGNIGPYGGLDFSAVPATLLKLAYNLISIGEQSAQERQSPHRYGASAEQIGAPLMRKWTFPSSPSDPNPWDPRYPNSSSPAIYKGVMYVVGADAVLYALDMNPARDLDGDGNPDDGILPTGENPKRYDFGTGAPYDIIWSYDFKNSISGSTKLLSSPVVATVNDPSEGPVDVVYISTEDGLVYAFRALPVVQTRRALRGEAVPYWSKPANLGASYNPPTDIPPRVPAPVYYAGRLFAVGPDPDQPAQGAVFELNPITGQVLWRYSRASKPLTMAAPPMGPIVASPSIGWVKDPVSGSTDLVMYVACRADPTNGQTARVFCFLLAARGERLTQAAPGDFTRFRGRYWMAPSNYPWRKYRIWVKGNPRITGTVDPLSPGYVRLSDKVTPDMEVYADYDVDCAADQYKPRTTFYAYAGTTGDYPDFLHTPVVGTDGTVYVVATSLGSSKCSLFAFQERSPISYVKWRYSLPDTAVVGAPSLYNGILYVGALDGRIIGFDTRATFTINIKAPIDLGRKYSVQILQKDPMLPPTYATTMYPYNAAQFVVDNVTDYDPSTRTSTEHGRIQVLTFSISGSSALDASVPVTVRYPVVGGQSAEEVAELTASTQGVVGTQYVAAGGSARANKIFDMRVNPGIVGGPTIAGDTMFVAAGDGSIWSYPSDPRVLATPAANPARIGTVPPAPTLASSPMGPIGAPMTVVGGSLAVNTPGGIMLFTQPATVIADSTRILEVRNAFDYSSGQAAPGGSEIIWSLSATTKSQAMPTPGRGVQPNWRSPMPLPEVKSFSHPSAVLRLSDTSFLVADTGNHRVVEVSRAGDVLWELTSFADPYNILGGSEPLTLNEPTDVQRWVQLQLDGNGNQIGVEVHTLVVDSGNYRILDIRDVYSMDPRRENQEYHVLVWASRTNTASKRYQYHSAQRLPDGTVLATVMNYSVNSADGSVPDTNGSSIVVLSAGKRDSSGQLVLDSTGRPVDPGGIVQYYMNGIRVVGTDGSVQELPIVNPVSFQRYYTGAGATSWRALMADGTGVYQLTGALSTDPKDPPGKIVLTMTGSVSAPPTVGVAMAKQLANGDILVVNKAQSQVWEYSPLPRPNGVWFQVSPITANTYALAQPSYADREQ